MSKKQDNSMNAYAIISFVLPLIGIIAFAIPLSIASIVCATIFLSKSKNDTYKPLAIIGIVLSVIEIIVMLIAFS